MSPAGAGRPARRRGEPSAAGSPEEREEAQEAALRLLAIRDRSASELRERLLARGYDRRAVEGTLRALREAGLQDDERFAAHFAEEATGRRGLSSAAVRQALRRRGVAGGLAERVATESPEAEEERALEVARVRAARLRGLATEPLVRRLLGFLGRRGFEPEMSLRVARAVTRELPREDGAPDPPADRR